MPLPLIPVVLGGIGLASVAFGAKKGYDAYCDQKTAEEKNSSARYIFEKSQESLNEAREQTNSALVSFGECKKEITDDLLAEFLEVFGKIKNYEYKDNDCFDSKIDITSDELDELKSQILNLKTAFGAIGAVGAGAMAGFGACGLTGALATASTGTAISTLSGAAATNATLAWLGGGSLATGGLGMAGGTMVLGGLVAGPALAVAGWVLSAKAEEAKNEAYNNYDKAKSIEAANNASINMLNLVKKNADTLKEILTKISYDFFEDLLDKLSDLVGVKTDFKEYSKSEQELVHKNVLLVSTIKNIISTPLVDEEWKITAEIRRVKRKGEKLLRDLQEKDQKYI